MARRRQLARATTAQIAALTPYLGEPVINKDTGTEKGRLHIGDGATAAGKPVAFKSEVDALATAFSGHTHVPADVTDLAEYIRDTMATALVAGANISLTPNDGADTITIAAAGGSAGTTNIAAPVNLGLTASAASGALTVTLTTAAGAVPSGADKVVLPFRAASAGSGAMTAAEVTSGLSLVLSSGSTLGVQSGNAGAAVWIGAFLESGGGVTLAAVNCLDEAGGVVNLLPLGQMRIASAVAEGGAGAADSAHVFYASALVDNRPFLPLARLVWNAALTPGTWTAPSVIELVMPGMAMPGDILRRVRKVMSAHQTITATVPNDDTTPLIGEGTEIVAVAITPLSTANVFDVAFCGEGALSASGWWIASAHLNSNASLA